MSDSFKLLAAPSPGIAKTLSNTLLGNTAGDATTLNASLAFWIEENDPQTDIPSVRLVSNAARDPNIPLPPSDGKPPGHNKTSSALISAFGRQGSQADLATSGLGSTQSGGVTPSGRSVSPPPANISGRSWALINDDDDDDQNDDHHHTNKSSGAPPDGPAPITSVPMLWRWFHALNPARIRQSLGNDGKIHLFRAGFEPSLSAHPNGAILKIMWVPRLQNFGSTAASVGWSDVASLERIWSPLCAMVAATTNAAAKHHAIFQESRELREAEMKKCRANNSKSPAPEPLKKRGWEKLPGSPTTSNAGSAPGSPFPTTVTTTAKPTAAAKCDVDAAKELERRIEARECEGMAKCTPFPLCCNVIGVTYGADGMRIWLRSVEPKATVCPKGKAKGELTADPMLCPHCNWDDKTSRDELEVALKDLITRVALLSSPTGEFSFSMQSNRRIMERAVQQATAARRRSSGASAQGGSFSEYGDPRYNPAAPPSQQQKHGHHQRRPSGSEGHRRSGSANLSAPYATAADTTGHPNPSSCHTNPPGHQRHSSNSSAAGRLSAGIGGGSLDAASNTANPPSPQMSSMGQPSPVSSALQKAFGGSGAGRGHQRSATTVSLSDSLSGAAIQSTGGGLSTQQPSSLRVDLSPQLALPTSATPTAAGTTTHHPPPPRGHDRLAARSMPASGFSGGVSGGQEPHPHHHRVQHQPYYQTTSQTTTADETSAAFGSHHHQAADGRIPPPRSLSLSHLEAGGGSFGSAAGHHRQHSEIPGSEADASSVYMGSPAVAYGTPGAAPSGVSGYASFAASGAELAWASNIPTPGTGHHSPTPSYNPNAPAYYGTTVTMAAVVDPQQQPAVASYVAVPPPPPYTALPPYGTPEYAAQQAHYDAYWHHHHHHHMATSSLDGAMYSHHHQHGFHHLTEEQQAAALAPTPSQPQVTEHTIPLTKKRKKHKKKGGAAGAAADAAAQLGVLRDSEKASGDENGQPPVPELLVVEPTDPNIQMEGNQKDGDVDGKSSASPSSPNGGNEQKGDPNNNNDDDDDKESARRKRKKRKTKSVELKVIQETLPPGYDETVNAQRSEFGVAHVRTQSLLSVLTSDGSVRGSSDTNREQAVLVNGSWMLPGKNIVIVNDDNGIPIRAYKKTRRGSRGGRVGKQKKDDAEARSRTESERGSQQPARSASQNHSQDDDDDDDSVCVVPEEEVEDPMGEAPESDGTVHENEVVEGEEEEHTPTPATGADPAASQGVGGERTNGSSPAPASPLPPPPPPAQKAISPFSAESDRSSSLFKVGGPPLGGAAASRGHKRGVSWSDLTPASTQHNQQLQEEGGISPIRAATRVTPDGSGGDAALLRGHVRRPSSQSSGGDSSGRTVAAVGDEDGESVMTVRKAIAKPVDDEAAEARGEALADLCLKKWDDDDYDGGTGRGGATTNTKRSREEVSRQKEETA